MKMVYRPNTVTDFQSIGFCQRRREPSFCFANRIGPAFMTWAQRRQRGRERTARAVGILGLHARRGKAYFAVAGEEPVRTFRIIKMPALHQHRPAAHRQQRIALLFHFPFSLRVRRAQQRGGFRKIGRDERYLRQQLLRSVSTAEAESSGSPLFASMTVSSTTFCT